MSDWKTISDEREKYAAYLCSREWCEKREAVRNRAAGKCERCFQNWMDHVHHLTYARKYQEDLSDLQAICKWCHDFTHGKSEFDPREVKPAIRTGDDNWILCPICDDFYVHFGRPRGDLVIPCVGECGHGFDVCFDFSKGNTSLYADNLRYAEMSELSPPQSADVAELTAIVNEQRRRHGISPEALNGR